MADTRFLIYGGYGNRQNALAKVKNYVQENSLSIDIPLVKFEQSRSKEFYFGLAIQTHGDHEILQQDKIKQMHSYIGATPIKNTKSEDGLYSNEDVKKFLAGNIDWEGFNAKIQYEINKVYYDSSDSEGEHQYSSDTDEKNRLEDIAKYNKFFQYISAKKQSSYNEFSRILKLFFDNHDNKSWPIMRKLLLLGHIEIDDVKSKYWKITPMTLTQVETNESQIYISGQVYPPLLEALNSIENIEHTIKLNMKAPNTHILTFENTEQMQSVSDEIGINLIPKAGYTLLSFLPSIEAIEKHLIEKKHFYDEEYSVFGIDGGPISTSDVTDGTYLIKHESTPTFNENALKKDGQWYVGPYYDVHFFNHVINFSTQPSLVYSKDDQILKIPELLHPPFLFEKALVLCSGCLPNTEINGNAKYLNYTGISSEFAKLFAEKTQTSIEWR